MNSTTDKDHNLTVMILMKEDHLTMNSTAEISQSDFDNLSDGAQFKTDILNNFADRYYSLLINHNSENRALSTNDDLRENNLTQRCPTSDKS